MRKNRTDYDFNNNHRNNNEDDIEDDDDDDDDNRDSFSFRREKYYSSNKNDLKAVENLKSFRRWRVRRGRYPGRVDRRQQLALMDERSNSGQERWKTQARYFWYISTVRV